MAEQQSHNYHPLTSVTEAWAALSKAEREHAVKGADERQRRLGLRSKDDQSEEKREQT